MNKLDEMSLSKILEKTSLCISTDSLLSVWRQGAKPQRNAFNPDGTSALEELKDKNLANELIEQANSGRLIKFLFAHEAELDKTKLVLDILLAYKENLKSGKLPPETKREYTQGLAGAIALLKDIDETYTYYIKEKDSNKFKRVNFINTKEAATGETRSVKEKNKKRLEQLESEEDLSNIIAFLIPADVEFMIPYSKEIGENIRFMIEHNTVMDELDGDTEAFMQICQAQGFDNFIKGLEKSKFTPEIKRAIEEQIGDINIDKLLMCSAARYLQALEVGKIPKEQVTEIYERIKFMQSHIKKNTRLENNAAGKKQTLYYDTTDLEMDMRRFIPRGDKVEYFTAKKCQRMKKAVISGEVPLNSLTAEEFSALLISHEETNILLKSSPNNYIFFLREGTMYHPKETILRRIIGANECSQELLKLLCEKTDITCEEIRQLFDLGIISTSDLESIKGQREEIITDEKIYEKYKEHLESRDEEESEKTRIQLERYALAYRKLELAGKTAEEVEQRGEEFVITVGEDVKTSDLIDLYGLDLIPLKVAVDWGGEDIIEGLLKAERLKPSDARNLRDKGLLNKDILVRLFQNCTNMSYAYQVALVYTVFDGQTQEEREAKQELAQYYHIENGISSVGKRKNPRQIERNTKTEDEPQPKIKMRDPGAKYNLLFALDEDVKIEEGIIDGHIIFHYPNVDGGLVLIEKLHKITTNKDSGLIEIKADNGCATYIISEEEFIAIKSRLIQNGKVGRTEMTQRWFRKPGYWIAHTGKDAWERGIKGRFQIDSKNPRYSSPEDLAKMEELLRISAESRDAELR